MTEDFNSLFGVRKIKEILKKVLDIYVDCDVRCALKTVTHLMCIAVLIEML